VAAPAVWVGPGHLPGLVEAELAGGGTVVDSPEAAEAIVWWGEGSDRVIEEVLHPGIRWVQLGSAGIEGWIEGGSVDRHRQWTSAAGAYADAVAEHVVALALAGARRLPQYARAHIWAAEDGTMLRGRTVGIVGAGGIGRALIGLLAPFRVRTIALTRSGRAVAGADRSVGADALPELLAQSDVVVLTAPLTPATRHLLDADALARTKPGAWIVNVGRGALIDTDALVDALRAGRLGGACLDVTEPEPLPDGHPLWELPNVLITPHVANTPSTLQPALAALVEENVRRFAGGEELLSPVDLDRGY
jgi:D-3-phosphoglycerate dehydrogenase